MAIRTVVTRGYGQVYATIALVVVRGYGPERGSAAQGAHKLLAQRVTRSRRGSLQRRR